MMRRSTLVGIIVVTMLFQSMLFSTATTNQPVSEIQTNGVGDTPDYRESVVQGDNYFNSTGRTNGAIYASFDDFNYSDFFKISLVLLSQNTWVDANFENGQNYSYVHNDTRYPDEARTGSIIALNDSINIDIYFDSNDYVEFYLRITKTETPKGITKDDAIDIVLGQPVNISLYSSLSIYTTFTAEQDTWYAFDIAASFNTTSVSIEFRDAFDQYVNYASGQLPTVLYNKMHVSGAVFAVINSWGKEQNITLTVYKQDPPLGYSSENPILLSPGESNDYTLPGRDTYFQATVAENQSYLFSFDFGGAQGKYFYVQVVTQDPFVGYYGGTSFDSNKGDFYYYSEQSQDVQVVLYSPDYVANLTVNVKFTTVDTPAHVTKNNAKTVELGDTQGQTLYKGQPYWMKFNAEKDVFYQININAYDWISWQIFDESGNQYDRNDAFISTSGTVYFRIAPNNPSTFTLHIEKGTLPSDVTTSYYSSNFQAGDYFEYSLNYTQNGENVTGLPMGSTFRVDVTQDAPSRNEYMSRNNGFKVTLNGDQQRGFGVEPFILPTTIDYPDRTVEGKEIIQQMLGGYNGTNISEANGQYTIRESYSSGANETYLTEYVYDAVNLYLVSYRIYQKYQDVEMDITLTLVDFKISGPRSTDSTGDAPLTLPFQPSFVLMGLILLPIIKKRKK